MAFLSLETTVGQAVAEKPGLARVFEKLGIDYCCGGKIPLSQACRDKGLDGATVLQVLAAYEGGKGSDDHGNWALTTVSQLIDHILVDHHAYLRIEMPRLEIMIGKVVAAHGQREPHLAEVQSVYQGLRAELEQHMMKEEQILFPLMRELETARTRPVSHCGSVENPIRVMIMEHEHAGDALGRLRQLTKDYTAPPEACNTYRALLDGLREMEGDLHRHIHEENNILFPKAVKMEAALA